MSLLRPVTKLSRTSSSARAAASPCAFPSSAASDELRGATASTCAFPSCTCPLPVMRLPPPPPLPLRTSSTTGFGRQLVLSPSKFLLLEGSSEIARRRLPPPGGAIEHLVFTTFMSARVYC
ncbi:hypothetical protein EJB05_28146, partial [Eragrostis curvula]